MKLATYSKETTTAIGMLERVSATRRKLLVEKLQELLLEQESENKWEHLLETHPEPMLAMANNALREHKNGKSKLM